MIHSNISEAAVQCRIDILCDKVGKGEKPFTIIKTAPDKRMLFTPVSWGEKLSKYGFSIQERGTFAKYEISVNESTTLNILLRGPDIRDENNKIVKNWVDYTKVQINGKDIIPSTVSAWHNDPYNYALDVKKGDIINLYFEWQRSKKMDKTELLMKNNTTILNQGEDNTILLSEHTAKLSIYIYGNHNHIIMDKVKYWSGNIYVGTEDCSVDNCSLEIGEDSTSNGVNIRILEDNSRVKIGKDCQFSSDIWIYCSDTHTITDMQGNIVNVGKFVTIGNHVWVGMNAFIGKNTTISDNCVVGMCSCVSGKKIFPPNTVIAGNPAKIIKNNINWFRDRPKQYIQKNNKIITNSSLPKESIE